MNTPTLLTYMRTVVIRVHVLGRLSCVHVCVGGRVLIISTIDLRWLRLVEKSNKLYTCSKQFNFERLGSKEIELIGSALYAYHVREVKTVKCLGDYRYV